MLEWPSTWTGSRPQAWPRTARWPLRIRSADVAIVFAGIKARRRRIRGVLSAVRRTLPGAAVIGCSATGVLTGAEEVENATAVAVLVLGGEPPLPTPLFTPGRARPTRASRARASARARCAALGGDVERRGGRRAGRSGGARRRRLRRRDRRRRARACSSPAPGASGGEAGCRVFWKDSAHADSAVALVLPTRAAPQPGDDAGLSGARRSADDHRRRRKPDPRDRGAPGGRGAGPHALGSAPPRPAADDAAPAGRHRRARLGRAGRTTSCGRSRSPTAIAPALAVAEPVRAGQTICFTLRDAIGARDDMKAMLDEQAEARGADAAQVRLLLQLRRARQRAVWPAGARSRAHSPAIRSAAARRDRKLVRDRPDLRAAAHPHVHRRSAARRLTVS